MQISFWLAYPQLLQFPCRLGCMNILDHYPWIWRTDEDEDIMAYAASLRNSGLANWCPLHNYLRHEWVTVAMIKAKTQTLSTYLKLDLSCKKMEHATLHIHKPVRNCDFWWRRNYNKAHYPFRAGKHYDEHQMEMNWLITVLRSVLNRQLRRYTHHHGVQVLRQTKSQRKHEF